MFKTSSETGSQREVLRWRQARLPILVPEVDEEVNPAGIKGLGELGNVGTAAAIASAVYNATGKRIRQLPIRIDSLIT